MGPLVPVVLKSGPKENGFHLFFKYYSLGNRLQIRGFYFYLFIYFFGGEGGGGGEFR